MKQKILLYFSAVILIMIIGYLGSVSNIFAENTTQQDGTESKPYIINSVDALVDFANSVNSGNSYKGQFVLQTCDIDLGGIEWIPIGLFDSENFFLGTYDGNGHVIKNLNVNIGGNNSFFGKLGGTVMNLGIDSGNINGACVGGITSHSSNVNASIINCYNKATVQGARAGGIADNFNGSIANCWTDCALFADSKDSIGGIISYDASAVVNCVSIESSGRSSVKPQGVECVDKQTVDCFEIVIELNKNLYYSANAMGIDYRDLNFWKVSVNGKSIIFSEEKAKFKWEYKDGFMKAYLGELFPYLLIIASLGMIIIVWKKAISISLLADRNIY